MHPYEVAFHAFQLFTIVFIGIPTVYALFWGAPFVPTPSKIIDQILSELKFTDGMTVYEPGCGDARFLISASKKAKINAIGFEYSPMVYWLAKIRNFLKGGKNVHIFYRDYFQHTFEDADVFFFYLLPQRIELFIKKLHKECKSGTIIVSYGFIVPGLIPYKTIPKTRNHSPIYFYKI